MGPGSIFEAHHSGIAQWQSRRLVSVRHAFDSRSQIHSGVVQRAERGTRNAVTGVRFSAPDPFFAAHARRRAWSSGRASAFQAEDVSSTLTVRSSFQRLWGRTPVLRAIADRAGRVCCNGRWRVGDPPRDWRPAPHSGLSVRSSFSGRISRCHREDTGSNPVDRSRFANVLGC